MHITLKRDLIGVDWDEVAELYWAGMIAGGDDPHLQSLPKPQGDDWQAHVRTTRLEFTGSDLTCLAYADGKCIGGVHALTDGARDAAVFGLVVHPAYRGQGVATCIMQTLLEDLENVSVLLNASTMSEGIFRKLGFRPLRRGMALRYSQDD
jgi:GNAT superfamily N-acetyltransferase